MANVTPNLEPGSYLDPQTVTLSLSSEVDYVNFTVNGATPAISEYIAYDTLSPPNPFIAVTQDGKGRVVYDGGFPKLYNNTAPAEGTGFSGLSAAHKYIHNAFKWIANPSKVAQGNKKILILGDRSSGSYLIKGTAASDFNTTLNRIAAAAGFQLTYKDTSDYAGGALNPTLAELEEYVAILLMSSQSGAGAEYITNAAVTDIRTFRENNNGVLVITDHGPVFSRIEDVYFTAGGAFFNTANKLVVNFGAFFTGNYNRTPVNVGFLRQNYGDHPLYDGLLDSESIAAGGSESEVKVATFTKYTQANLPPFAVNEGRQIIQVLARLHDGSIETYRFIYTIASGELLSIKNLSGTELTELDVGWGNKAVIRPTILGSGLGSLSGVITRAGVRLGTITYTEAAGSRVTWDGNNANGFIVNDDDVVQVAITVPFSYIKSLPVSRVQPSITAPFHLSQMLNGLRSAGVTEFAKAAALKKVIDNINTAVGSTVITPSLSTADMAAKLREYFKKV